MKKILTLLLCMATLCSFAGCSENSSEDFKPDREDSNPENTYDYVKTVTGYSGNYVAATSTSLKIYKKGNVYYATVGKSGNYAVCSKNSTYNSSYTGSDPKKKYRYCATPLSMTYYFDL